MNSSKINCINTYLPQYSYSNEEVIIEVQKWIKDKDKELQNKIIKIFENANIKERHTITPIDTLFSLRSFENVNDLYKKEAIDLVTNAVKDTLEKSNLKATDVDCIIATSCTGFMIPSICPYLINNLNMRNDVRIMPITEIGCTAGSTALIYADDYIKAYPKNKVLVVSFEFPSNTIQLKDFSMENIIGTAIFADGIGCAIVSGEGEGIEILNTNMIQVPNTTNILGYNLTNDGLNMNLDKKIPLVIYENFDNIVKKLLEKSNLEIKDINSFLIHPGGIKILDYLDKILAKNNKKTEESRTIMQKYGNLSSATIFFIIKEFLNKKNNEGTSVVMSFGPGFTAHQLLIKKTN